MEELREECGRRRLKVSEGGKYSKKAALIVRIAAADKGEPSLEETGIRKYFVGRGGAKPGPQHEAKSPDSAAPSLRRDMTTRN